MPARSAPPAISVRPGVKSEPNASAAEHDQHGERGGRARKREGDRHDGRRGDAGGHREREAPAVDQTTEERVHDGLEARRDEEQRADRRRSPAERVQVERRQHVHQAEEQRRQRHQPEAGEQLALPARPGGARPARSAAGPSPAGGARPRRAPRRRARTRGTSRAGSSRRPRRRSPARASRRTRRRPSPSRSPGRAVRAGVLATIQENAPAHASELPIPCVNRAAPSVHTSPARPKTTLATPTASRPASAAVRGPKRAAASPPGRPPTNVPHGVGSGERPGAGLREVVLVGVARAAAASAPRRACCRRARPQWRR